ncbi:MAG: cellulase family glycosylhydrolase [Planctomycetota bacterium]
MPALVAGAIGAVQTASAQDVGAPGLPESIVDLEVSGPDLVDADGNIVNLRLINVGNWFLIESWMYGQNEAFIRDQATFLGILASRFGQAAADALIEDHRDRWITQRDFDIIASAGFNGVRIPMSHLVLESSPFQADLDGFARLRAAVRMAANSGLYVVVDMHSVPGGQSLDQPSGDVTMNELWTDPEAQDRLVWLWQRVARELKNEPNFVAYDLINEPFGDFQTDIRNELVDIVDRTIVAIRRVDPNRLIYVPATQDGLRFYGDPADRGWTNVGLTEHFYPGIFDGRPATLGTHARFLESTLRDRADYARSLGVPFLWGEFNPVTERAANYDVIRASLDRSASLGIGGAVWSYKRLLPPGGAVGDSWQLVTNQTPLTFNDIRTASLGAMQVGFGTLDTMPLLVDADYLAALDGPPANVLPVVVQPPLVAPATDAWPLWTVTDVGPVDRPGGQSIVAPASLGADEVVLYTSGDDLFGSSDSLRLAARQAPPEFVVSTVVSSFDAGRFAKSGVTLRASTDPASAHLSLSVFPDGRILVTARGVNGVGTSQRFVQNSGFPVGVALGRDNNAFQAWATDEDGDWQGISLSENPAIGVSPFAGVYATSNGFGALAEVRFDNPLLSPPGVLQGPLSLDQGQNVLANPSFEQASGASNQPDAWSLSDGSMSRQDTWTPVRDGTALLAYRHWEANSESSSASQTISGLTPGQPYVFTVYANRDAVGGGASIADSVELRVETTGASTRWLESVTFDPQEIATSGWTRLQVRFTPTQTDHVVRIVLEPGPAPRDGAVKFDGLVVEADPG